MSLATEAPSLAYLQCQKRGPDATDRRIFQMIRARCSQRAIADELGMAKQSVEKRVHWLQAKRWATADGRMLNAEERDELIEFERQLIRDR